MIRLGFSVSACVVTAALVGGGCAMPASATASVAAHAPSAHVFTAASVSVDKPGPVWVSYGPIAFTLTGHGLSQIISGKFIDSAGRVWAADTVVRSDTELLVKSRSGATGVGHLFLYAADGNTTEVDVTVVS